MRPVFAALIALCFTMPHAHAAGLAHPTVGEGAPAFSTSDALSSAPLSLEGLKGKIVVLEWNNFGCPFVMAQYDSGAMQALQKEATGDGVVWITVNSSAEGKQGYLADAAAAKEAVKTHAASPSHYVLDHDGSIGRAYGATTTPNMFVIDTTGKLAYAGAINDRPTASADDAKIARNYVRDAIAALRAGKTPNPAQTKPYGCGVKYAY